MKKIFALICVLVMALTVAGCGGTEKKSNAGAGKTESKEIVIGLMPDTDSIPFLIAEKNGYFKEEGVNVKLQPFKSAMDRDAAMQSGNLDGAVSDMLAVAFAKAGGFDVKVTSFTDGSYRLVAGKDANISAVSALNGKDVAVSKNTIIEYVTDMILDASKMTGDDINKVSIPQIPTRLEMLQNGKLTAATLPEPMGSIAVHNGCRLVMSSDDLGINPGVMMFTAKTVAERGDDLKKMYRAYNKAVKYLNSTSRDEYIDFVVEKSGFPAAAKEALVIPKYREAALPAEKDVSDTIAWLNKKGLINETYKYGDIVVDILSK
ncbi:MAG: ABC transporter substrate-binding protein [Selenomonadaceae bacterium]